MNNLVNRLITVFIYMILPALAEGGDQYPMADFEKKSELFDYAPRDLGLHSQDFSNTDKGMLAVLELLNLADWTQTRQIARKPTEWVDTPYGPQLKENWESGSAQTFIGKHPSRGEVNALFGIQALLYPLIAKYLPDPFRKVGLAFQIGAVGNTVNKNKNLGLDVIRY